MAKHSKITSMYSKIKANSKFYLTNTIIVYKYYYGEIILTLSQC